MDALIIFWAKYIYLVVGLVAGVYWLMLPQKVKIRVAVYGVIAGIVALVLTKLGGALFYDPRPFVSGHVAPLYPHGADNGFPSDHTVLTAFVAVTIYSVSKKLGIVLLLLSATIGISRVLAHIHNPIDIVGSLVFAGVGGLCAYYLTPRVINRLPKGSKGDR